MENEFMQYLNSLKQCVVTESSAGGGAGSIILMELTSVENESYILWIECGWRIEIINKVIATSVDDIEAITGLIAKSTKMLEGKVVESINVNPFYDLCINFSDGYCLRVFCIYSYSWVDDINWRLSVPNQNLAYEITNQFKIKKGKYC